MRWGLAVLAGVVASAGAIASIAGHGADQGGAIAEREPRARPGEAAEGPAAAGSGPAVSPAAPAPGITYRPPLRGAPKHRVGGATRGLAGNRLTLHVLAPEGIGLTTSSQPVLYWFSSTPVPHPVEVLIINDLETEPLLEARLLPGLPAGIHRFAVADHGFVLPLGVAHRWSVVAVVDEVNRSRDVVASGGIRRVERPAAIAPMPRAADPAAHARIYAESGLWYDALDALSRAIAADPGDRELRLLRASLLEQESLPGVAAFDRAPESLPGPR